MKITVVTNQRYDHANLLEWFAYYLINGADNFVFVHHNMPGAPADPSVGIIEKLKNHLDITAYHATGYDVRLTDTGESNFEYVMRTHRMETDWLLWPDADQFYYPIEKSTVREVLADYHHLKISALAIYWCNYGSNYLETEPEFITQGFTRRSNFNAQVNYHVNSIVHGKHAGNISWAGNPHLYNTQYGTYDLAMRPVYEPLNSNGVNMHDVMRINHYYNRSQQYWREVKMLRGPGDRPPQDWGGVISDDPNYRSENNDVSDTGIWDKFGPAISDKVAELKEFIK